MSNTEVDISKRHSEKPVFSAEKMTEIQSLMSQFPEGKHKSAILRVLHIAEEEFGGWLSI